jgi:hypothetical protein
MGSGIGGAEPRPAGDGLQRPLLTSLPLSAATEVRRSVSDILLNSEESI